MPDPDKKSFDYDVNLTLLKKDLYIGGALGISSVGSLHVCGLKKIMLRHLTLI